MNHISKRVKNHYHDRRIAILSGIIYPKPLLSEKKNGEDTVREWLMRDVGMSSASILTI